MSKHQKEKHMSFAGPYIDGPTASTADICYVGYRTGVTTAPVYKPHPTPTQINDAFAGNYDPVGGFPARFPGYVPPADVKASVDAYQASQSSSKKKQG